MKTATASRLDSLADLVSIAERTRDRAAIAFARAKLFDHRRSRTLVRLAARLDALASRSERFAPKSYRDHRRVLTTIEVELGVLEGGLLAEEHAAPLRAWLSRAIDAEAQAFGDAGYGAAGKPCRERIDEILERAPRLGVKVSYTPGAWERSWFNRFKDTMREAYEQAEDLGARSQGSPDRRPAPDAERRALAAAFDVDLDAPADELKRRIRELAHEHHPDHGGDPTVMVRVNRLRELLQR